MLNFSSDILLVGVLGQCPWLMSHYWNNVPCNLLYKFQKQQQNSVIKHNENIAIYFVLFIIYDFDDTSSHRYQDIINPMTTICADK